MARVIQIAPRVTFGPVTDLVAPVIITVASTERSWAARLDPNHDYPTCTWKVVLEMSLDNQATWQHWRTTGPINGILLDPKGNYPAIGGTFADDVQPTHLRGIVSVSEQVTCGLIAATA